MKKVTYEDPIMEIIEFEAEDIIVNSLVDYEGTDTDGDGLFDFGE